MPIDQLSLEETQRALDHDAALKEQVARNKARHEASMPPMSPQRAERIASAQRLRAELGGFASMPPDVRATKNVREQLWPKVQEYARLRMDLALEATVGAIVSELRLTEAEIHELTADVKARTSEADTKPNRVPEVGEPPVFVKLRSEVADLKRRMARLEAKFDMSDVADPSPV